MKKIMVLMIVLTINVLAIDTQALLKAHKEALKVYQSQDRNISKSIELLRGAGIKYILNKKPENMSKGRYAQLLNDYGFFLQQSANFDNNVTFTLNGFPYIRNKAVVTDERYLDHKLIKNFTEKTKNLCEAVNYLDKTIEISPKRTSAYLNLADTYWQLYLYKHKLPIGVEVEIYGCKTFKTGYKRGKPKLSILYFKNLIARKSYLVYQNDVKLMQEKNKKKLIPARVTKFLQRPKRYIVTNDVSPATGDATVCQDLQKAFDKFDCKECKDDYVNEVNGNHLWLYKSIGKRNTKFIPIFEPTVYKYFYSHGRKDDNKTGMFHYKYNDNIYIFGNSAGVKFSYWSKRIAKEGAQVPYRYKCDFEYINLKEKNKWENEL